MSEAAGAVFVAAMVLGLGALFEMGSFLWMVFLVMGAVCIVYFCTICIRASSLWQMSEAGIAQKGEGIVSALMPKRMISRTVAWRTLTGLRLKYYATRRDQENGWFELTLIGPDGKITLTDSLIGFDHILHQAVRAADHNGVSLNEVTKANLARCHRPQFHPITQGFPPA